MDTPAKESHVERELKQRAALALCDPSTLLLHAITMNESPARARLRAFRHLTGQPQMPVRRPPPPATDNHVGQSSSMFMTSVGSGTNVPSAFSTVLTSPASSSASVGAGGRGRTSESTSTAPSHSSRRPPNFYPIDDEFAPNIFQGPVSP